MSGTRADSESPMTPQAGSGAPLNAFEQAVRAHEKWTKSFERAVRNGGGDMQVEVVRMDSLCPLDAWLDGVDRVSDLTASGMLREVHAEFHLAASNVLSLALEGRVPEAVAAMCQDAQYGRWSGILGPALRRYAEMASAPESRV